MMRRQRCGGLVGLLAGLLPMIVFPLVAHAVDCVSFAALQNPTPAELDRLTIKLTFVGPRMNTVNSLVFRTQGAPVDIEPAAACHKAGIDYTNDAERLVTCAVTGAQMTVALDSLATMPSLTAGGLEPLGSVGVVVFDSNGQASRVFDSIIDEATVGTAMLKLQQAFATNDSAVAALSKAACRFGIGMIASGTNVSDRVVVTFSGARYRRNDGLYAVTAKIKNTSTTTLAGPAVIVVRFNGAVVPSMPDGFTPCNGDPPATAFFRVLETGGSLAPNASTEVVIRLANPLRQKIRPLRVRVVAGI